VNVREDHVLGSLNEWIGSPFAPEHIDETVARLLSSQDAASDGHRQWERLKARVTDAETRLRRHRAAIEAGVDPAALVEVINDAQSEREAARAELDSITEPETLTDAEIYAMIDSLGDVGATLEDARPAGLSRLYESLRLELRYEPGERVVIATASPRSTNDGVRGRSCTLSLRLDLG
jgi:hypothetical protein